MPFTNIWDNTQPPDTQAANQLGLDLRNVRVDVQQRLAAISGADASKPNFEPGFAGVIYVATDTAKIYQFTGVGWTLIGLISPSTGQFVIPGGTVGAPGLTFTSGTTSSGIYSDAADTIKAAIAGVMNLRINATNVDFFVQPVVDGSVAAIAQSDQSGKLLTTNFLTALAQSGLRSNLGNPGGYIAFPKWLTGGASQLIVKWGSVSPNSDPYTVTFDATVPFTAAPVVVAVGNSASLRINPPATTASQFTLIQSNGYPAFYVAIGHN